MKHPLLTSRTIDLTDQKFGRLTAKEPVGKAKDGSLRWRCECECGNETIVTSCDLRKRGTKPQHRPIRSCGCLAREQSASRLLKHGATNCRDARTWAREYVTWADMKARCNNPNTHNYYLYGGRGIKVCVRWQKDYTAFLSDMGPKPTPKHTIDRINPDGDYEPGNCRWATASEQQRNRRDRRHLCQDSPDSTK